MVYKSRITANTSKKPFYFFVISAKNNVELGNKSFSYRTHFCYSDNIVSILLALPDQISPSW